MVALERPYANLFFHKDCYNSVEFDELIQILQENADLWYNYIRT